ncbi:MAG: hypothetical protein HKN47_10930 [Pirellulaceae bacterium]|nr:hypothetical protein [Pirellulaceae bacterium]
MATARLRFPNATLIKAGLSRMDMFGFAIKLKSNEQPITLAQLQSMKNDHFSSVCILLVIAFSSAACRRSSNDVTDTPRPADSDIAGETVLSSDVTLDLPDLETGSTHALRAEGTFNPYVHDRQNPFEFQITGRMSYRIRLTIAPFVEDTWLINPLIDITNSGDSRMFAAYYAAFYNQDGRLVGCCKQDADVEPSQTPLQLGSLVIQGPKERLHTATHFKMVIYESKRRIGSEPISADSTTTMAGRSGKVISKLEQLDSTVQPSADGSELRLRADLQYEDPVDKSRNTHLKLASAAKYDLYLTSGLREVVVHFADGTKEQLSRWESDIEFDQNQRVKGVSSKMYAVLLDQTGKIIVCNTDSSSRRLTAPEDKLLSARQLELVAYETIRKD